MGNLIGKLWVGGKIGICEIVSGCIGKLDGQVVGKYLSNWM